MRKLLLTIILFLVPIGASAQITITNAFSTGQVITAAAMNENFSTDLGAKALNRTGGSITGNITVSTDVTLDGVDISDYLATNIFAQDSGAAGDPSFSWVGDPDNGMFLGGTNIVDFATAGTARVRIAADGTVAINSTAANALDIAGGLDIGSGNVSLVGTDGRLEGPLSTTIIDNLSGVNLTTLNASALASGTVPTARLGSGTASSSTFLRGDNSWQAVTAVAGSDHYVQYNNAGTLAGNSAFIFNDSTDAVTIAGTTASSLDIGGGLNAGTGNVALIGTDGKIEGPLSSTIIDNLSGANLTALNPDAVTNSYVTFDSGDASMSDGAVVTMVGNIGHFILFIMTGEADERNMNMAFVDTANQDIILNHTQEGGSTRWSTAVDGVDMWNLYFISNELTLQNTRDDCSSACAVDWFIIKAT